MKLTTALLILVSTPAWASADPLADAYEAFKSAKCGSLVPVITHDMGNKTYAAYSTYTINTENLKMPDGFKKKVFVFEESPKCSKMWDNLNEMRLKKKGP